MAQHGIRWQWNRNLTVGETVVGNAMCIVWKSTHKAYFYRVTSIDGLDRIAEGELYSVIDAMLLCVKIAANHTTSTQSNNDNAMREAA